MTMKKSDVRDVTIRPYVYPGDAGRPAGDDNTSVEVMTPTASAPGDSALEGEATDLRETGAKVVFPSGENLRQDSPTSVTKCDPAEATAARDAGIKVNDNKDTVRG